MVSTCYSPESHSAARRKDTLAVGFSLIELLVCVAIIGVLAAVVFSAVNLARSHAMRAQCASNLRQLGQASIMYAQENNKVLPLPVAETDMRWHGYIVWDAPGGNRQWCGMGKLYEYGYITDGRSFYCPTAKEGEYDYDSQWGAKVSDKDHVSGGFRIGYQQRVSSVEMTLYDDVNHIIMTDLFASKYSSHGHHGVSMLYMDGHVRYDEPCRWWGADVRDSLYEYWEKNP